jgi:hypothetical protein
MSSSTSAKAAIWAQRRQDRSLVVDRVAWLKTQAIDDALIQPYSGHATRRSLEIYSCIALSDAQQAHDDAIRRYPV